MKPLPCLTLFLSLPLFAQAQWKPVEGRIMTPWAAKIDPAKVWQEHPNPQLERSSWKSLNGLWSYAVGPKDADTPPAWDGEILVPFAPEAALSGVGKLVEPHQALWYQRKLDLKKSPGKRQLLHFEAVDYEATVWLNGKEIGRHTGAHTAFTLDATDALRDGENELLVRVHDATGEYQLLGKQKLDPGGIWYTRVTGIWQSVWTEEVADRSIEDLDYACDIAQGSLTVTPRLRGQALSGESVRVTLSLEGRSVATASGSGPVRLKVDQPRLWSPESPTLYDVTADVLDSSGKVVDSVRSYTAFRELGKKRDANGHLRFTLNGKPVFHWGPLDQGWWPDGLLTPPSDEAMLSDIQFLQAAGFNMIRKHIKIEPRRYYWHCDRLGMLVWQDQVSQGYGPNSKPAESNPPWTRLAPNPKDGNWPDAAHQQFVLEYKRMVDQLRDHPSIVVWSPFNEAWGQHRTMEVGKMAVDYDRTRPVNIASGGNFWPVGDIADEHAYPNPAFPLHDNRFKDYVKVVGEFGGHGWPVQGHLWDATRENWGYGGLPKSLDEWKERYTRSLQILCGLRREGISAGVYTQTTDVEGEINGLLTYDRVPKVDPAWLKQLHERLYRTPDAATYKAISDISREKAQTWSYTTQAPAENWSAGDFNDSAWAKGEAGFGTRETPNTTVRTEWNSPEIWLRRGFDWNGDLKGNPVLRIFHDEDALVFLNGVEIARLTGFTGGYVLVDLDGKAAQALKKGRNVLAIHVRQTQGGQYIDAGLFDESVAD